MTTFEDPWENTYKTIQAYKYNKREETVDTGTSKKQALCNARRLIEGEEMAKLKAEKKDVKKKRQKERKKVEKGNNANGINKSASTVSLNSNSNKKIFKTETDEDSEDWSTANSDRDESADDEFLDINAAFVKVSVKQNRNVPPNKKPVSKPDKVSLPVEPQPQPTVTPIPKIPKPKKDRTVQFTAEALGMRSCRLALCNNDCLTAIDFLSRAIFLAPEDVRHSLNRSYCYLRTGQFKLALDDAQFAKKNAQSSVDFVKAVAREGQALCGLHKYHQAEKCFEEILKLEQGNEWVLTELILTRASQLTNMGFSKIQALEALQQCSAVVDAVTLLTSGYISNPQLETNGNKSEVESCDGDEIYSSDDESSSTILLSKLVSAISDEACYFDNVRSQPSPSKAQYYSNSSERTLKSNVSTESLPHSNGNKPNVNTQWEYINNAKSAASTSKTHSQKPIISESTSVWVGSIEEHVTNFKLKELFSKFGPINNVQIYHDKHHAFIDFTSKRAATKALNHPNDIELNGVKLPVRPAQGTTGKK